MIFDAFSKQNVTDADKCPRDMKKEKNASLSLSVWAINRLTISMDETRKDFISRLFNLIRLLFLSPSDLRSSLLNNCHIKKQREREKKIPRLRGIESFANHFQSIDNQMARKRRLSISISLFSLLPIVMRTDFSVSLSDHIDYIYWICLVNLILMFVSLNLVQRRSTLKREEDDHIVFFS